MFGIKRPDTLFTVRSEAQTLPDKKKSKEKLKRVSVFQFISDILKSGALMDRVEEHTDHHHDWSNSNVGWMRQDDTES